MGAMSPVSIAATLAQQVAEALAGVALAELVRPGTPVILGSFLSNTDMQSGSPSLGSPKSAIGLLCGGQIARRLGIPWRSGGGALTSSQTVDAQAAYESMMTMLPTFLAGLSSTENYERWLRNGGHDACQRAAQIWEQTLAEYEQPFMDDDLETELRAYVAERRTALGD